MDECDDLSPGLQPQAELESMLLDPDRFCFPNELVCIRAQNTYLRLRATRLSKLTSTAGAEWVIAPTEITSTPVFA